MIDLDKLFPRAQGKPVKVREAFDCLGDNPKERVKLLPDSKTLLQMSVVRPGKRCQIHHSHHRLTWMQSAPTVDRGGGAGAYHIWHPGEQRPITVSEVKRLASFPDLFKFTGQINDVFERIGNSVPPLFIRAIARQIKHILFNGESLIPYPQTMSYLDILEAAWLDHLKPREPDAPTVISTFAGGGGSSLGYSMAGYKELLAVEWDNNAVETFRLNFPGVPVYHGDIAQLSVEECLRLAGIEPGELDLLEGSPPCQGFSTAGKRMMDDPRNQLFREFVRLLRGLRPKVFLMENVSGMVKGKMKLIFVEILKELKASGYRVSARLMNAMYFNVPQSRERMIFIGVREDLEIEPSHPRAEGKPVTVKEAWAGCVADDWIIPKGEILRRMPYIIPGKSADLGDGQKFNTKKLHFSRPSNSLPKQMGASLILILHPSESRSIAISEAKRIGSFPDLFEFYGTMAERFERIGNSVPPLLSRSIARHIRQHILAHNLAHNYHPPRGQEA